MTAFDWKQFYAAERQRLGDEHLRDLLVDAAPLSFPLQGALIFPHTKLRESGHLTARVVKASIESGAESVLALGALHGGRRSDSEIVQKARAGDRVAIQLLRKIHGQGNFTAEEFSLDNFEVLLELAASHFGKPTPRLIKRYPFLTGEDPNSLPGVDELHELVTNGAVVVATTDPIHHGVGYETDVDELLDREDPRTLGIARAWIEDGFDALLAKDYVRFQSNAKKHRSDFRDVGPVLPTLLPNLSSFTIEDMTLVDYSDVLATAEPTWVAASLTVFKAKKAMSE